MAEVDSAKIFAAKFKRLKKGLKLWARTLSDLKKTINDKNFMILYYDTIEEFRDLTLVELNGRNILKEHLAKTLEYQRIYWKQRATIRQIKVGEANTKKIQAKATIKHRNNHITMVRDEQGHEHFDHTSKAAIIFRAFKERLGSSANTQNPLLLHNLILQHERLSDLEAPFTKEEIYEVVKNMHADKSTGPDGFNDAFLKKMLGYYVTRLL